MTKVSTRRGFLRSPTAIVTILVALASTALALAVGTDALAEWMAHPARVNAQGVPPATTFAGAASLRFALVAGPWLVVLIVALLDRLLVPRPPVVSPISRRALVTLAALLVAGAALRALLIGQSLWYDELVAFGGYTLAGPGAIIGNYYSQANHVLSQLLLWCSTAALGVDELSLRLPSFLASLATIVAAFALGREVANERAGLLCAAAMTVMPIVVLAGADARGYSLVILGATLANVLALRARRTGSVALWTLYALVIALAAWAHLVAVMVALGHAAWFAYDALRNRDRAGARAGIVALVAAAVMTLTFYAPILPDLLALRGQFRATSDTQPTLMGIETWHALLGLGGAWTWWAALPGLALALVGLRLVARDPRWRSAVIAAFLGFPIAYAFAALGNSWLYARFLQFATPASALLIAAGLMSVRRRAIVSAAFGVFAIVSTIDLVTLPPRQPLRDALILAASMRTSPSESIGVIGLRDNPLLFYATALDVPLVDFGDRGANLDARLAAARPRAIVVLYPATVPAERTATLQRDGYARVTTLPGWIDWGAGAVDVWRRD